MALEDGFRRITMVISIAALSVGLALTAILTTAIVWLVHLERQREATLIADGCPIAKEQPLAEVTIKSLGSGRWQVKIPESSFTSSYVVSARQTLSSDEIIKAVKALPSESEIGKGRRHPKPNIEVIDCAFEDMEIAAERNNALSNRLVDWWMTRPGVGWTMVWVFLPPFERYTWLFWPGLLIPAVLLTSAAAGIPWALFYLIRWIARGFART